MCRAPLPSLGAADLAYEDVLSNGLVWAGERLFEHLGLLESDDTRALLGRIRDGSEPLSFEKTTSDDLRGTLTNFDEVLEAAKQLFAQEAERQFQPLPPGGGNEPFGTF
jgi:hypothetical protein